MRPMKRRRKERLTEEEKKERAREAQRRYKSKRKQQAATQGEGHGDMAAEFGEAPDNSAPVLPIAGASSGDESDRGAGASREAARAVGGERERRCSEQAVGLRFPVGYEEPPGFTRRAQLRR